MKILDRITAETTELRVTIEEYREILHEFIFLDSPRRPEPPKYEVKGAYYSDEGGFLSTGTYHPAEYAYDFNNPLYLESLERYENCKNNLNIKKFQVMGPFGLVDIKIKE